MSGKHVMIDLETMGTTPGSAIVAIGAVRFGDGYIYEEFYETISLKSCQDCGFTIDAETVIWWMKQKKKARQEITGADSDVVDVSADFSKWFCKYGDNFKIQIWGNSPSFDNALLGAAYRMAGLPIPWNYYQDRCYRTVKNMHPKIPLVHDGVPHHALDDAKFQAQHLMKILNHTGDLSCPQ